MLLQSFRSRWKGRFLALALLAAASATATAVPREALALDRDTRAVIIGGGYGLLAGTLAGLVSLPLHQDVRGVFIGSSVGLYLGIAVGFYHVFHRDDPGNPLRASLNPQGGGEPGALEADAPLSGPLAGAGRASSGPVARLDLPVLRF